MAADPNYPARVHKRQDGNLYVPSGASIVVESGGAIDYNGTAVTGGSVVANDITGGDSSLAITGLAGSSGAGGAIPITGGVGDSGAGGAVSATGGAGNGAGAGGAASVAGGVAGATSGAGGAASLTGGAGNAGASVGGAAAVTGGAGGAGATTVAGGVGGAASVTAGAGGAKGGTGAAAGGAGGASTVVAGAGGATASSGSDAGGAGGGVTVTGGVGGAASAGTGNGGAGGAVTLTPGLGGATTGGTAGAPGAVVVNGPLTQKVGASTVALGTNSGNAAVLPAATGAVYPTTAADDTVGVRINAADQVTGRQLFIGNGVSNKILKIYPPSGGTINGAAGDAAFSTVSGKGAIIICLSSGSNTWLAF